MLPLLDSLKIAIDGKWRTGPIFALPAEGAVHTPTPFSATAGAQSRVFPCRYFEETVTKWAPREIDVSFTVRVAEADNPI